MRRDQYMGARGALGIDSMAIMAKEDRIMKRLFLVCCVVVALSVSATSMSMSMSIWNGKFLDPERVVAEMAANPRSVALWMESNFTDAQCRALEVGLFQHKNENDALIAAQRARIEVTRAGIDAKVIAEIDKAIADIKAAIEAKAPALIEEIKGK